MSDILTRITSNPEIRSGKPVIRGTRITVLDVLEYMAGGMTPEEILDDFPDLVAQDLRAVMAFAAERERSAFSKAAGIDGVRPDSVIMSDPEVLGGTPVFTGTRVPVESLIQHLSAGAALDDFLHGFPGVSRSQAERFLGIALNATVASISR